MGRGRFSPLTSTPDLESLPAISPGGEQIVYATRPNGYGALALEVDLGMIELHHRS
jgi:hypothetical protein